MNTLFLKKVDGTVGLLLTRLLPRPAGQEPFSPPVPRLLLVRPGGIGDAVLLVPAILALRRAWPKAVIQVLAESRNAEVFGLCPEVDKVSRYDRRKEALEALVCRYDAVIDTEQWHRLSAVVARLVRSQVKVGYGTNERKKLFTHPVSYSHETPEARSFFDLLKPLGILPPEAIEVPFLKVDSSAREMAGELLGELRQKRFAVLFPGASIPERRWGVEKFRSVAESLANEGVPSVVVGGREDAVDGAKIVAELEGLNLAGRTSLTGTAAVIDRGAVLLSGDSGILHVGVGLGMPTVSLFGPGIAEKWAPRGQNHIVFKKNLPCSPCTRFGYTPKCSSGAKCLQETTAEEVTAAVLKLLRPNEEGVRR